MEKITHEFKAGDWVDMTHLDDYQRSSLRSANGVGHLKVTGSGFTAVLNCMLVRDEDIIFVNDFIVCHAMPERELTLAQLTAPLEDRPFTHDMIRDWLDGTEFTGSIDARMSEIQEAVSKFDMNELEAMDRLENKKLKGGFVSSAVTVGLNELSSIPNVVGHAVERHDQEIDSGDNYNDVMEHPVGMINYQEDQPYTPQVGDKVYLIDGFDLVYGHECKGYELTVMCVFMDGDVNVAAVNLHGVNYCFVAKALTIKTERDIAIEKALALDCDPSEGTLSRMDFVGAMYDAGLIK